WSRPWRNEGLRSHPELEEASGVYKQTYLIRYGLMSQVGRFLAPPDRDVPFERGQVVVIQSCRGLELGEVLIAHDHPSPDRSGGSDRPAGPPGGGSSRAQSLDPPRVIRLATPED